jgi:hypothetical protein
MTGDSGDASGGSSVRAIRQVSRRLPEWGDLEVIALIAPDGVYFPLKVLSFVFLGDVNDRAQRARVRRDPILRELTRVYPVETPGGRQQMVCLERLGIGRWINGVEINRLRPEIRERFLAFQWELTRLADRLLFGETPTNSANQEAPGVKARLGGQSISDDELLVFLQYLARRIGSLEIDVAQVKRLQHALLGVGSDPIGSDNSANDTLTNDKDKSGDHA